MNYLYSVNTEYFKYYLFKDYIHLDFQCILDSFVYNDVVDEVLIYIFWPTFSI